MRDERKHEDWFDLTYMHEVSMVANIFAFIYYWFTEEVIHSHNDLSFYNLFHLMSLYSPSLPTMHVLRAGNIGMVLLRKHTVFFQISCV